MEFDELLGHLDDLAQLAGNEGFALWAALLDSALEHSRNVRSVYGHRVIASPEIVDVERRAAKDAIDVATAFNALSQE